jgi:uncharacterized repeat protein (TIGR03803 family)
MRTRFHPAHVATIVLASLGLAACGGYEFPAADGGSAKNQPVAMHTLGGTVTGLPADGLVLANGSALLVVASGATTFTFPSAIGAGTPFAVSVSSAPTGLTCSVANGAGTMGSSNITAVHVTCSDRAYSLGGTISGLTGAGLVLANGTDSVSIAPGATTFALPSPVAFSSGYAVTVAAQPAGQGCLITNGSNVMPAASVSDIQVACGPPETVLYSFPGGADGANPDAGLVEGVDGNFYGTTPGGGTNNNGTVFKITPGGTQTVLYRFAGAPTDGTSPYQSNLILASDGNFYGTTTQGGAYGNQGTVFKITPSGTETVLWSFGNGNDGANPNVGLIQASDGNFYGTTAFGGANGAGTIFRITPAGAETVLWSFTFSSNDGSYPYAGVTQGQDGNFYGVAGSGGANGTGVFYKLTPSGTETILWSFGSTPIAASPNAGIIQDSDGTFYGTTAGGGLYGAGTVYRMTPSGLETTLWSFGNGTDGSGPNVGLTLAKDGNFYGIAGGGGVNGNGVIYRITRAGAETVLWSFGAAPDGANNDAPLVQGSDGNLYGTTQNGGTSGYGTVFRYIP